MRVRGPFSVLAVILLLLCASLSGCLGDGQPLAPEAARDPIWMNYVRIDQNPHDDMRIFTTVDLGLNASGETTWAVFDRNFGGNCCEHYLATSVEGSILNIGGEYPVWSDDRGHVWDTWQPGVVPDPQCRTFVPTNPGTEGLGEGSIVQATNGDIIAMSWFPYPGGDLKLDKFYAILYDDSEAAWRWCYNRITEPFYDRSWQVEVVGPIDSSLGSGEWASLVVSNFWHQSQNAGGQISVDGLNYYPIQFPDRGDGIDEAVVDLGMYGADLGPHWDVNKPHKEMRAFPVPAGGLMFPSYFDDGSAAFLDTTLSWNQVATLFPSEYCQLDRMNALHCVTLQSTTFSHHYSLDGGLTWQVQNHSLSESASSIEEWEFQANAGQDLFVLNARYQDIDGPDVDIVWHVRGMSESLEADTITYIGLGDLDSTSGAGNDIRFDFASLGVLPDGGVVVAYHDSSHEDPLFAVELDLPI